jgi:hypothetical protein
MSRSCFVLLAAISLSSLSACDRLERTGAGTQGANSGTALVFAATRSGQSLHVSEIVWPRLWSLDDPGPPGPDHILGELGVSAADAARVLEFARDAKARMRELQRSKYAELCAMGSALESRHAYVLAYLERQRDVAHFENILVLEFFEMLGEDTARQVAQHVHESRLHKNNFSSTSMDNVVYHVMDSRDWQTAYADFCAGVARIYADEAAAGQ